MSLSSALSVAMSGLQTSSALMQLSANNVANAQTPGYTEKSATLSSTVLGSAAGGVEITGYTRATDSVLQQSYNTATANASYLSTQNGYMQQVQQILDFTANNPALSSAIANFAAAWTQLQASPDDPTIQQAVVQAGNNFAQEVDSVQTQANSLQAQAQTNTQNTVTQLNSDLTQLASLNQQIFSATGADQPTGDLQDERDTLVNQISQIVNVTVIPRAQGEIALYTPDGVALLDSTSTEQFSYNGTSVTDSSGLDVTSDLTGGSLQAELQFTANSTPPSSTPGVNTIQQLQGQIQDLENAFTNGSAFATAYNPGLDPTDDFFTTTGGFAVNSSLLSDPTSLSADTASATAATFTTDSNFSDSNSGLSLPNGTTTDLVNTILSNFQQAANTINTQSQSATQQQQYYQQSLSNETGVNVDDELVNLTTLQNTYAASAHVIATITEMFNDLMNTL